MTFDPGLRAYRVHLLHRGEPVPDREQVLQFDMSPGLSMIGAHAALTTALTRLVAREYAEERLADYSLRIVDAHTGVDHGEWTPSL